MEKFDTYRRGNPNYQIRTEQLNGKKHLVVPVVMMVEGVHSGSRGPLFHSAEQLGHIVAAWNGIPITIKHPQDNANEYVSANSPTQIERSVGKVFNAHMDGDKLKAEAWLEENKLQQVSPETLAYIRSGRPLDVSVGVFTDEVAAEGVWNDEPYTAVATNHRPDHLALLPGETGACSWQDGCGIRVNSKNKNNEEMTEEHINVLKSLNKEGFSVAPVVNSPGLREILEKLNGVVNAMDNEIRFYYLEEVFDNDFVYRVRNRQNNQEHLYKQMYSVSDAGEVTLSGEPIEVTKQVTYQTLQMRRTKMNNNSKKDDEMQTNISACKLARIEKVIANTHFEQSDVDYLATLEESVLDKMIPKEADNQVNVNQAIDTVKATIKKPEDVLGFVSEEMRPQIEEGLKLYSAHRTEMEEAILKATDQFTKEELSAMNVNMLEKLQKSVVKAPAGDFSANGEIQNNAGGAKEEEILLPNQ